MFGAFTGIPAEVYHAVPGVSHSMLCHMDPPARLPVYLTQPREETPEMILGTLGHAMILEPDKPLPRIVVQPETYPAQADSSAVKQKKASVGDPLPWHNGAHYCKRWHAEARESGLIVLTQDRMESLHGMVQSVSRHNGAAALLANCETEVSVFHPIVHNGITRCVMRARMDIVPSGNALADVKTCDDASPEEFARKLADGYATQASHYLDLWNEAEPNDRKDAFVFIAVERRPPYLVACYVVGERTLSWARDINARRLRDYIECAESRNWRGFPGGYNPLDAPLWALRKSNPEEALWG